MKPFKQALSLILVFLTVFVFAEDGIKEVETAQDFDAAIQSSQIVVADFYATWCPPCQKLAPVMNQLSHEFKGKAAFIRIDVDKAQDLTQKYDIGAIPDVRIFFHGKQINKIIGLQDKEEYEKAIQEFL